MRPISELLEEPTLTSRALISAKSSMRNVTATSIRLHFSMLSGEGLVTRVATMRRWHTSLNTRLGSWFPPADPTRSAQSRIH